MTCYDSENGRAFILEENISLERYFHKRDRQSAVSMVYTTIGKRNKISKSSKHIQRPAGEKQNAVKDYLLKVTRWIAEYCRKEIRCVVVETFEISGKKRYGHKTNQFHSPAV